MRTPTTNRNRAFFSVLDIPPATNAQDAEALLEAHRMPGFRIIAIVPWEGGARVFAGRRDVRPRPGRPTDLDGKEEAALALVRDHSHLSNRDLAAMLKERDMPRGKDWVRDRKKALALLGAGPLGDARL